MSTKHCNRCNRELPIEHFGLNNSRPDGHHYYCKECVKQYAQAYKQTPDGRQKNKTWGQAYYKTPKGLARRQWNGITHRAGKHPNYLHVEIKCTRDQYIAWAEQEIIAFLALHPNERPSVDRIDPKGHYEFGNIQIISLSENTARANRANGGEILSKEKRIARIIHQMQRFGLSLNDLAASQKS